ncbi:copper amine oxidase N-terminal domain-containing protein [Paenibacillus provencensis]|uniref:Copper amine oxidase N-terminal domain-containing protein n=1 Tax=Paenibacillus provencensis TaxID=441151 RepID=A0ABW3PHS1_9BACL|nr:stalk domain-containing protein [Paenibacillus sp. MER 78]MCM3126433.1 stalk domain-containing protein [Paenibacillus sp. MER 78]
MNFKKLSILTVFAASQVLMAFPVSAQSDNAGLQQGQALDQQTESVQGSLSHDVKNNENSSDTHVEVNQDTEPAEESVSGAQDISGDTETGNVANSGNTAESGNNAEPGNEDSGEQLDESQAAESTEKKEQTSPSEEDRTESEAVEQQSVSQQVSSAKTNTAANTAVNASQLILFYNSSKMIQDGVTYYAPQPMVVKSGVSYVPIRALVDRVGYKVSYNYATKETLIIQGNNELRFKTNSSSYTVNGVSKSMKGASYQTNNTFMVPLTSITQALGITYSVDNINKRIILNLSNKPVAKFSIQPSTVYAGDTVTYVTAPYSPKGLAIINERWEGRQDVFEAEGNYTVSYYVQDSSGTWSDPYTITINVERPNQPPIPMFTTDKEEYKMGELITYKDESTDDEYIVDTQWDNNASAFFTPGPKTIRLTVTDNKGASRTYEKTIIITNETLYTLNEFNRLFTPIGEEFSFDGSIVPTWDKVNYTYTDQPGTLIRSNSPETVNREGILYQDSAVGSTRFLLHHLNNTGKKVKMYVVATNNNSATATLRTENLGLAGPTNIAQAAGKKAVQRYFETMQDGTKWSTTQLKPGESKLILTDLSLSSLGQSQIISLFSDVYSNYPIDYKVIMIDEKLDPLTTVKKLPVLDRDGVHNRGTYENPTRIIKYSETIGEESQRLVIGDNKDDPNVSGVDPMVGVTASNSGNFGVLYKITLDKVAPNTLISFNPRGGTYSGYAMVNGMPIPLAKSGGVSAPNEQVVLYRTGNYEQKVEIWFTAAPASSLPINLLFTALPQVEE